MNLSEFFSSGIMTKRAKLLRNITLDNGETMPKGTKGHVFKDYGDGTYHFEDNDNACRVARSEVKFL